MVFPPGDKEAVEVTAADLARLDPGEFLNDTVIDYYIKCAGRIAGSIVVFGLPHRRSCGWVRWFLLLRSTACHCPWEQHCHRLHISMQTRR